MSGRHRPSLAFAAGGAVAAVASGCFDWAVHRRRDPIAFLTTSLAGLGAGEALEATVEVEAGATGTVTTQGPSSLLRTARDAVSRWHLRVGPGGHLTFLPWLTLPYPGSRSVTEVSVRLEPGATLCAWDVLAVGRIARGELLELAGLRTRWTFAGPDGPLLDDRLRLDAASREEAASALAGLTHVGTLYLAGLSESSLPLERVRSQLAGLELAGASRPTGELLVVRGLDRSAERLEQAFWPLVCLARDLAGVAPLAPSDAARRWFRTAAGS